MAKVLEVKDLCTSFFTKFGEVKAVNHVSFDLEEGDVLAIVGESGSGKSVTSMSVMGLVAKGGKIVNGEINFCGQNLVGLPEKEMEKLRGKDEYDFPGPDDLSESGVYHRKPDGRSIEVPPQGNGQTAAA